MDLHGGKDTIGSKFCPAKSSEKCNGSVMDGRARLCRAETRVPGKIRKSKGQSSESRKLALERDNT